ncbi:MAG: spermidine synthase [Myxococcota bacterium]|jgi:spermidine synthase
MRSSRQQRWVLYLAFVVSGAAGLIYEVVWASLLAQLVGGTTATHTIVLAAFMGGLALGNRVGGRYADGDRSPLRLYAYLETIVGVLGILSPWLADIATALYGALAPDLDGGMTALDLPLRLGLATLCILPGAMAMGGTLPALVRASTEHLGGLGESVGWLYFINSSGATAGAFLAGFVFIPSLGHNESLIAAGSINLVLAVVAFALSRREAPSSKSAGSSSPARTYPAHQVRAAVQAVFVSGIATMIVEIVWTRLLTLTLGGSAHAFSIMLGTFIGGIALGGVIASRVARNDRDAFRPLLIAEAIAALSLLALFPFYDRLPWVFWSAARVLRPEADTYGLYLLISTSVAVVAMAIPTLAMGATLPLASRVATPALDQAGRQVGNIFSINTLGNVIGASVGGLILVPTLGIETTLRVGVAILVLAALRLIYAALPQPRRVAATGTLAAVALASLALLPGWRDGLLHSGLYRYTDQDFGSFESFLADVEAVEFLYASDDAEASVSVVKDPSGQLFMRVNGKTDASSRGDVPNQLMLGAAPLLMHPAPSRVLIVGLGSGLSVTPVIADSRVQRIDVVEISPAVVEASRLFDEVSGAPLDDPRVHLYETDGRSVLSQPPGGGKWDVIVSEPSNPWQAGSAALFTAEYFELLRDRLAPGGIACVWFHSYEMDEPTFNTVLRTYGSVFPEPRIFNPRGNDFVALASVDGPLDNIQLMAARLRAPEMQAVLTPVLPGPQPLDLMGWLALEIIDPATFRTHFGTAGSSPDARPLHRDRHPILQYLGPRGVFKGDRARQFDRLDRRLVPLEEANTLMSRVRAGRPFDASEQAAIYELFAQRDRPLDRRIARALALHLWLGDSGASALGRLERAGEVERIGQAAIWDRRSQDSLSPEACRAWIAFEERLVRDATSSFTVPSTDRVQAARACIR